MNARLLAFYLPQFHPTLENDLWWGKGFTEWANVAKAQPLYRDHYQPHVPGDLGFYDLRVPETRVAQAELARQYGIGGFCYWHYWFEGKRLLERPFNEVMATGEPNFPVCLAWANESWSRRWLGEETEILQAQTYSAQDDIAHARWLAQQFGDTRYMRVNDRPLFLIYRPRALPEPQRTLETMRGEIVRLGSANPYLVGIDAHAYGTDMRTLGFDDTLAFEPQLGVLEHFMQEGWQWARAKKNARLTQNGAAKIGWREHPRRWLRARMRLTQTALTTGDLKLYADAQARLKMAKIARPFPHIPSVYVSWDNSPRRGRNGVMITPASPQNFQASLESKIAFVQNRPTAERLVFINAWNEWAEGNHLEPDLKFGHAFLEAVRKATHEPVSAAVAPPLPQ